MRIDDDFLRAVCFVGVADENPHDRFGVLGTGFFVGIPAFSKELQQRDDMFIVVVTAKHVLAKANELGKQVWIRMNNAGGQAIFAKMVGAWIESNDPVDLAIHPVPGEGLSIKMIHLDAFVGGPSSDPYQIGIGDKLIVVGLFGFRPGTRGNIPAVRQGILSAMPTEPLIDERSGLEYDAYLAELISIGGLSGSPAFVLLPQISKKGRIRSDPGWIFVGVVRGHWTDKGNGDEAINVGMAVITPAEELAALINEPVFVKERKTAEAEELKKPATPPPTTDSTANRETRRRKKRR